MVEAPAREVHLRRSDEAADEEVGRPVVEHLRRVALLEVPVAHDRDAIAHRHRLDLVVRDVDGRRAELLAQAGQVGPHLHAQLGVEVRQRLVHQERLWLADDRAPDRDALTLAARERPRAARDQVRQPEPLRRGGHPLGDRRAFHALHAQREAEVAGDVHVRVERVALEDHRDVAVLGSQVVDYARADADRPLGGVLQAGEHPQGSRLARARRADEDHQLAVADLEAEVAHRRGAVREDLAHALEGETGHQRSPPARTRAMKSRYQRALRLGARACVSKSTWTMPKRLS